MTISLRILLPECGISASASEGSPHAEQLQRDVRNLANLWMAKFQINPNPNGFDGAAFEFITQGTLDYIDALEGVLEWMQADAKTPDAVLERIEKVLR